MALPRRIRLFAPLPTNLASAKPITVPPRQEIPPLRLQSSLRSRPRPTRAASQHLPRIHRLSRPRRRHLRRRPRRRRSPAARLRRRHGPEAGPSLAGRLLEELGRVSLGREEKRCFVFCLFSPFCSGAFPASSVHLLLLLSLTLHIFHVVWIRHTTILLLAVSPFVQKREIWNGGTKLRIYLLSETAGFFLCRYHYSKLLFFAPRWISFVPLFSVLRTANLPTERFFILIQYI